MSSIFTGSIPSLESLYSSLKHRGTDFQSHLPEGLPILDAAYNVVADTYEYSASLASSALSGLNYLGRLGSKMISTGQFWHIFPITVITAGYAYAAFKAGQAIVGVDKLEFRGKFLDKAMKGVDGDKTLTATERLKNLKSAVFGSSPFKSRYNDLFYGILALGLSYGLMTNYIQRYPVSHNSYTFQANDLTEATSHAIFGDNRLAQLEHGYNLYAANNNMLPPDIIRRIIDGNMFSPFGKIVETTKSLFCSTWPLNYLAAASCLAQKEVTRFTQNIFGEGESSFNQTHFDLEYNKTLNYIQEKASSSSAKQIFTGMIHGICSYTWGFFNQAACDRGYQWQTGQSDQVRLTDFVKDIYTKHNAVANANQAITDTRTAFGLNSPESKDQVLPFAGGKKAVTAYFNKGDLNAICDNLSNEHEEVAIAAVLNKLKTAITQGETAHTKLHLELDLALYPKTYKNAILKVLNLEPGATFEQFKEQTKQMARKLHPDKCKNDNAQRDTLFTFVQTLRDLFKRKEDYNRYFNPNDLMSFDEWLHYMQKEVLDV